MFSFPIWIKRQRSPVWADEIPKVGAPEPAGDGTSSQHDVETFWWKNAGCSDGFNEQFVKTYTKVLTFQSRMRFKDEFER